MGSRISCNCRAEVLNQKPPKRSLCLVRVEDNGESSILVVTASGSFSNDDELWPLLPMRTDFQFLDVVTALFYDLPVASPLVFLNFNPGRHPSLSIDASGGRLGDGFGIFVTHSARNIQKTRTSLRNDFSLFESELPSAKISGGNQSWRPNSLK